MQVAMALAHIASRRALLEERFAGGERQHAALTHIFQHCHVIGRTEPLWQMREVLQRRGPYRGRLD